jgi:hypothetical protein
LASGRSEATVSSTAYSVCLDCSSTLKTDAVCISETSVETLRTTRRHIPVDDTLHRKALTHYQALHPGRSYSLYSIIRLTVFSLNVSVSLSLSLSLYIYIYIYIYRPIKRV